MSSPQAPAVCLLRGQPRRSSGGGRGRDRAERERAGVLASRSRDSSRSRMGRALRPKRAWRRRARPSPRRSPRRPRRSSRRRAAGTLSRTRAPGCHRRGCSRRRTSATPGSERAPHGWPCRHRTRRSTRQGRSRRRRPLPGEAPRRRSSRASQRSGSSSRRGRRSRPRPGRRLRRPAVPRGRRVPPRRRRPAASGVRPPRRRRRRRERSPSGSRASCWSRPKACLLGLLHPGPAADLVPDVVELRAPHGATGGHLYLRDLRGVEREDPLDCHPEGVLPDGERLVDSPALARDTQALEDLYPLAVALYDAVVHPHRVARLEGDVTLLQVLARYHARSSRKWISGAAGRSSARLPDPGPRAPRARHGSGRDRPIIARWEAPLHPTVIDRPIPKAFRYPRLWAIARLAHTRTVLRLWRRPGRTVLGSLSPAGRGAARSTRGPRFPSTVEIENVGGNDRLSRATIRSSPWTARRTRSLADRAITWPGTTPHRPARKTPIPSPTAPARPRTTRWTRQKDPTQQAADACSELSLRSPQACLFFPPGAYLRVVAGQERAGNWHTTPLRRSRVHGGTDHTPLRV